jgi:hypothetical protein
VIFMQASALTIRKQAHGLNFNRHVGHHELDCLKIRDRLTEDTAVQTLDDTRRACRLLERIN